MTRFDAAALAWAILLCLALGGAIPSLVAVLVFPGLLALAVFGLGFLQGVAAGVIALRRGRR